MNDRSAKIGVWAYLLFTLASFALALYLLLAEGGYRYNVSLVALPVWMAIPPLTPLRACPISSALRTEPPTSPVCWPLGGYL